MYKYFTQKYMYLPKIYLPKSLPLNRKYL